MLFNRIILADSSVAHLLLFNTCYYALIVTIAVIVQKRSISAIAELSLSRDHLFNRSSRSKNFQDPIFLAWNQNQPEIYLYCNAPWKLLLSPVHLIVPVVQKLFKVIFFWREIRTIMKWTCTAMHLGKYDDRSDRSQSLAFVDMIVAIVHDRWDRWGHRWNRTWSYSSDRDRYDR